MSIDLGPPHLFANERPLFDRAIADHGERYLEFGMGGSTLLAIQAGSTVIAVDSDPAWVAAVTDHHDSTRAVKEGRAKLLHSDIGPTSGLGYPTGQSRATAWPSYVRIPWEAWSQRRDVPSLVYVDGRFRVACCLSVVAGLGAWRGIGADPRVLLHDFDDTRPHYKPILQFFDVVEAVSTLHLLRPKPDASPLAAMAAMLEFLMDPR